MSRVHESLHLYRQPLSGDWQAVKVSKDGMTITDKYPLDNTRVELQQILTDDKVIQNIQKDIKVVDKNIKAMGDKHIRETILYIINNALSQVTAQNEDKYHA